MVNKTSANLNGPGQTVLRFPRTGLLAACLLSCSLTGCVANWSVLGERISGGTHPGEIACPTCAAPQTVVAIPAGTQPQPVQPLAQTNPPGVPPAVPPAVPPSVPPVTTNGTATPNVTQLPQPVPPVTDGELAACRDEVDELKLEMMQARQQHQEQVTNLLNRMEQLNLASQKRDQDDTQTIQEMRKSIEQLTEQLMNQAPPALSPAPNVPQQVNDVKALPPVNGSL